MFLLPFSGKGQYHECHPHCVIMKWSTGPNKDHTKQNDGQKNITREEGAAADTHLGSVRSNCQTELEV